MEKLIKELKFKYIYHSCFLVEFMEYILIFDYYKDSEKEKNFLKDFIFQNRESIKNNKDKKILIFSSHSHSDHFNPKILNWDRNQENISYILSSDIVEKIQEKKLVVKENYIFVEQNEKIDFDKNLQIYTFGSTDLGVSFFIKIRDKTIFHAGDLNWWNWGEEDTLEEAEAMERDFKSIVSQIKEVVEKVGEVDLAFFPVDPRLGNHKKDGAEYFKKTVAPKFLIPMHYE